MLYVFHSLKPVLEVYYYMPCKDCQLSPRINFYTTINQL